MKEKERFFRRVMATARTFSKDCPRWWATQEIKIYQANGVRDDTVSLVAESVASRFGQFFENPLTFRVYDETRDDDGIFQILSDTLENDGSVKEELLSERVFEKSSLNNDLNAKIIITKRPISGDMISWGGTSFTKGLIVLYLHSARQDNKTFLANVVAHEAGHLLGALKHCDTYQVEGYKYHSDCGMHYSCPTANLCPKCRDWIYAWWAQIA